MRSLKEYIAARMATPVESLVESTDVTDRAVSILRVGGRVRTHVVRAALLVVPTVVIAAPWKPGRPISGLALASVSLVLLELGRAWWAYRSLEALRRSAESI